MDVDRQRGSSWMFVGSTGQEGIYIRIGLKGPALRALASFSYRRLLCGWWEGA